MHDGIQYIRYDYINTSTIDETPPPRQKVVEVTSRAYRKAEAINTHHLRARILAAFIYLSTISLRAMQHCRFITNIDIIKISRR